MDPQHVQRTRYVLRTRVRRAQTLPVSLFPSACKQLVGWLSNHPIFSAIIRQLESQTVADAQRIRALGGDSSPRDGESASLGRYEATTTEDHAAVCWAIVRLVSDIVQEGLGSTRELYNELYNYLTDENDFVELEKAVEIIRDVAVIRYMSIWMKS